MRTEDIYLQLEPGQRRDPRLKKPDVLGAFTEAGKGLKALRAMIAEGEKDRPRKKKGSRLSRALEAFRERHVKNR